MNTDDNTLKKDITTNEEYVNIEELDELEVKGDPDQQVDATEQNQSEDSFAGEDGAKEEFRQDIAGDRDTKDDE
jgi:hypothetical protein